MNWREATYLVWTDLKQNFDDGELTLFHCFVWLCIFADRLKEQHIEKRSSGAFLTDFIDIPIQIDAETKRKYFTLPAMIYDMDKDKAISYISYNYDIDFCTPPFTSITFNRTTPAESRVLYYTEEERPSPVNPYFYRLLNNVYFLGIEDINVKSVEAGLYITFDTQNMPDLSDYFPFPQELIQVLIIQLNEFGRYILMIPSNKISDGTQKKANKLRRNSGQQQQEQEQLDQQAMADEQNQGV